MTSKRSISNLSLTSAKMARTEQMIHNCSSSHEIVSQLNSDIKSEQPNDPEDFSYIDLNPIPIPNFFEIQDGGANSSEIDESEPHSAFHNTLQEYQLTP